MDILGVLGEYIKEINSKLGVGDCSELTHRPEIEKLFKECFAGCQVIGEQKKIDSGKPDFTIIQDKIPIGFVETKDIGIDLGKTESSNQLKRYYEGIGNVIVTDYIEFRLYSKIAEEAPNSVPKPVLDPVVIATQDKSGKYKLLPDAPQKLSILLNAFVENSDKVKPAGNPKELTIRLASIAKIIRDAVLGYLEKEEEESKEAGKKDPKDFGPYHSQLEAFKKELIGDITSAQFADMYAQTICYGMLAAKHHSESTHKGNISDETASRRIPKTNPFLVKVFDTIAGVDVDEKLGKWINVIAKLLNRANITEILAPKKGAFEGHDPIFYFYENFLAEYDPTLREKRGVYYTPLPVVSFIVRSVDKVLKQDFGLKDGLACDAKIDDGNHKVLILDPATGTGTFLNEVLEHIYSHFKQKGLIGMKWGNDYIQDHILPRLFGFELMMAPYTIAHLKVGISLSQKGYDFNTKEATSKTETNRLGIYLTNTLEKPILNIEELDGLRNVLSQESFHASDIKKVKPIMIVMGNPPYSGHSMNKNYDLLQSRRELNFIGVLMEEYKRDCPELHKPAQAKWLQDDYVKFIRFAQDKIEKTGYGILAFINNHSFIDNPTFRGMRKSLLKTFDKIYICDLHGNSKKKEAAPDGSADENVFDIQQGVSINIFVKDGSKTDNLSKIYKSDFFGKRETKYKQLMENDIFTLENITIDHNNDKKEHFFLFLNQDKLLKSEYEVYTSLPNIFNQNGDPAPGVVTTQDEFAISWSKEEPSTKVLALLKTKDEDEARKIFKLCSQDQWNYSDAIKELKDGNWKSEIVKVLYRPFDTRYTVFNKNVCVHRRERVMRHMLAGENLGLTIGKAGQVIGEENWDVLFCTRYITEFNLYRRGGNNLFPLYLYPDPKKPNDNLDEWLAKDGGKAVRRANLSPEVVKGLESMLCARFVSDGKGNITKNETPQPPLKEGGLDSGSFSPPFSEGDTVNNFSPSFSKGGRGVQASSSVGKCHELTDGDALTFGPEDIFNYIYAILHSPTYRTRYAEFLKIDFPRIPFTSNTGLFAKLAVIGEKLVGLHLLEDVDYDGIGFPELGDNKVEKLAYNEQKGEVWINSKQYFSGIAQNVWEFHIGGYQVAQKWLKDRKGRTLAFEDIETYMKAMTAIRETIGLMQAIDETIEAFGGYPIS